MNKYKKLLALMSFVSSFITGVVAMVIGSEIGNLIELYNKPIETVVLFGSGAALGRIFASLFAWKVVNKFGPIKTELAGNILIGLDVLLLPFIPNYYVGMVLSFLGGLGMSLNDNSSPAIMAYVFPKTYSSMLSAGQTMYCFGNFAFSLLISLFIKVNVPYYYTNIICVSTLIISITCALICLKVNIATESEEEKVQPIYCKNIKIGMILVAFGSFAYCAVCNCIGLYTTTYLESVGFSTADSSVLYTIYNIGSTIGSILFIYILRKVSEKVALIMNTVVALGAISLALSLNTFMGYAIGLFLAGCFLGVTFALLLSLGTRIQYNDPASASSLVGLAGGVGDITIPIMTSAILTSYGIGYVYNTSILFLILTILIAIIIYLITKEKKENA